MLNPKFITVLLGVFAMAELVVEFDGETKPESNTKGCLMLQKGLSQDRVLDAVENETDTPVDKVSMLRELAKSLRANSDNQLDTLTEARKIATGLILDLGNSSRLSNSTDNRSLDSIVEIINTTMYSSIAFSRALSDAQIDRMIHRLQEKWTTPEPTMKPLPTTDGLAGHWDAMAVESITKSGAKVTKWEDISGNGYDLTSSTNPDFAVSAINGHPAVRFSGGNYLASETKHPTYGKNPFTWFVVCQFPTFQAYKNIFSTNDHNRIANGGQAPTSMATDRLHTWGGPADKGYTPLQANKVNILTYVWDGSSKLNVLVNFGKENFQRVVHNWNLRHAPPQGYVAMGRGMQNGGHNYDGFVGEAIAFSKALSDAQINAMIDHLQEKWTTEVIPRPETL